MRLILAILLVAFAAGLSAPFVSRAATPLGAAVPATEASFGQAEKQLHGLKREDADQHS